MAPIGGSFQWHKFGVSLRDASGARLDGIVAVFRFHPQAALRVRRLIGQRYDERTDGRASRPVPWFAAIRGGEAPAEMPDIKPNDPPLAPTSANVGAPLTHGTLSFHDERGLIIDPVAVAAMFRDLLSDGFPALLNPSTGSAADLNASGNPGGLGSIAGLATGTRLHIVDMFGGAWGKSRHGRGATHRHLRLPSRRGTARLDVRYAAVNGVRRRRTCGLASRRKVRWAPRNSLFRTFQRPRFRRLRARRRSGASSSGWSLSISAYIFSATGVLRRWKA